MTYLVRKFTLKTLGLVLMLVILSGISAHSQTDTPNPNSGLIFIVDNSGSMADVFGDDIKVNKAKEAINEAMKQSNFDMINLGLLEMGGHCEVKELVRPKLNNRQAIVTASNKIRPRRYLDAATPIAEAIYVASKRLKNYKGEKRIILVSDGEANCQGVGEFPLSACDMVASLKHQGINFFFKMIGYGATNDRQFKCIADLSEQYSYTQVNNQAEAVKEIEKEVSNPFEKSQTFIEQLTEFLKSFKEFIAIVIAILILLGVSKTNSGGGTKTNIQKW